jgi:hypothetical protein
VSNVTFNFTLGQEELCNINGSRPKRDESASEDTDSPMEPFNCCNISLNTPFAVRAGDVVGACVIGSPDRSDYPTDQTISNVHRLNVVSEVNNRSQIQVDVPIGYVLLQHRSTSDLYLTSCQMNEILPAAIIDFETHFSPIRPRRLHISANIMNGKYNIILCVIYMMEEPIEAIRILNL